MTNRSVPKALYRQKGRRSSWTFSQLPHHITDSSEYARLSPRAVKLLVDLLAQFRGANNGDLSVAPGSLESPGMLKRGWRSKSNLAAAIKELMKSGFIVRTRVGGRHRAALFAITWLGIDECGGKLEIQSSRVPPNLWKDEHREQREHFKLL